MIPTPYSLRLVSPKIINVLYLHSSRCYYTCTPLDSHCCHEIYFTNFSILNMLLAISYCCTTSILPGVERSAVSDDWLLGVPHAVPDSSAVKTQQIVIVWITWKWCKEKFKSRTSLIAQVIYRVFQTKIVQSLCTTILQPYVRVMRFSAKCSERNCLHDKVQCLNMAIRYSLFCSWPVNCLKTKLTAKSLTQICGTMFALSPLSRIKRWCSVCGLRERKMDHRTLFNSDFRQLKMTFLLFKCRWRHC